MAGALVGFDIAVGDGKANGLPIIPWLPSTALCCASCLSFSEMLGILNTKFTSRRPRSCTQSASSKCQNHLNSLLGTNTH